MLPWKFLSYSTVPSIFFHKQGHSPCRGTSHNPASRFVSRRRYMSLPHSRRLGRFTPGSGTCLSNMDLPERGARRSEQTVAVHLLWRPRPETTRLKLQHCYELLFQPVTVQAPSGHPLVLSHDGFIATCPAQCKWAATYVMFTTHWSSKKGYTFFLFLSSPHYRLRAENSPAYGVPAALGFVYLYPFLLHV